MDFLDRLRHSASDGDRIGRVLEIMVLQALTYQVQGDMQNALSCLHQALRLAEPEGYIRIFADEGQSMRQLLSASLSDGANPEYIARIMNATDPAQVDTQPDNNLNQLLIEPLSERELDVLNLMANGRTNQAIADELFIALSTVKKHINNIYGKLNVPNRTQAINRARALGIVS